MIMSTIIEYDNFLYPNFYMFWRIIKSASSQKNTIQTRIANFLSGKLRDNITKKKRSSSANNLSRVLTSLEQQNGKLRCVRSSCRSQLDNIHIELKRKSIVLIQVATMRRSYTLGITSARWYITYHIFQKITVQNKVFLIKSFHLAFAETNLHPNMRRTKYASILDQTKSNRGNAVKYMPTMIPNSVFNIIISFGNVLTGTAINESQRNYNSVRLRGINRLVLISYDYR